MSATSAHRASTIAIAATALIRETTALAIGKATRLPVRETACASVGEAAGAPFREATGAALAKTASRLAEFRIPLGIVVLVG
jgi:hypothetical protein